MGTKRLREDDGEGKEGKKPSLIRNKERRSEAFAQLKREKKKEKKLRIKARDAREKECIELGEAPPPRKTPRTIENTREPDETIVRPDDDELLADIATDEFAEHFNRDKSPKLLITTCRKCSKRTFKLILELQSVIPNTEYYKRNKRSLKQLVKDATEQDFTAIVVIHENRREPDGMVIVNLPEGPTAHFRLSNLVLRKEIKNHGRPTSHLPELILNNFTTSLGHRIGRMFASLFYQDPNFRGRRVVTFHNQRDYIFFRHHRYVFEPKETKQKGEKKKKTAVIARLQECGPRFTLKLLSLQHGTFDTKHGEYEWVHKPDMDTSRRRFFL
ncbi:ribosome production factor 1-like [Selaginella moellendorffii]|uniref:ribosome production factor 1-like n=1 Tax=Selaginella moellendorffii TaxID=88036 RepID=UPI000D1C22E2|nr:ribosome production factor 1-like [Selaginella moellendorffii]|eukprot:XP_024521200.1 ribosome production factor 1-like [Selaginella moellendorffii]